MATYNKFQDFVEQLGLGVHNLSTHVLTSYLSNELPLVGDTVKTDVAEITPENGYRGGMGDIQNVWSESPAGTGKLVATDVVYTATVGGFGPFQYAVIYNEDATSPLDALICWWDYGSSISCNDAETFTIDFGTEVFTLT